MPGRRPSSGTCCPSCTASWGRTTRTRGRPPNGSTTYRGKKTTRIPGRLPAQEDERHRAFRVDSAGAPPAWHAAVMAARTAVNLPVTVVVGEEEFLVDRTVRELLTAASGGDDHHLDGAARGPGERSS